MRFFLSLSGRDIVEKKPELAKRFIKALVEGSMFITDRLLELPTTALNREVNARNQKVAVTKMSNFGLKCSLIS
jgi:ABC-type nitrate/sulfonate/bicarbonate transport system substrate-binding protein